MHHWYDAKCDYLSGKVLENFTNFASSTYMEKAFCWNWIWSESLKLNKMLMLMHPCFVKSPFVFNVYNYNPWESISSSRKYEYDLSRNVKYVEIMPRKNFWKHCLSFAKKYTLWVITFTFWQMFLKFQGNDV